MSLLKMGVPGIYIREGEEDDVPPVMTETKDSSLAPAVQKKIDENTVQDRAKVRLTESVKARVAEGVQYLYNDTSSENFTSTTKNITDDLMRAIDENDAVAVDISALKVSDEYTFKHSVDVATMSMIVGRKHGLNDNEVYELGISGLLHDVGKSKIPNEILNKATRLTDEEYAMMKQHSLFGYGILKEKGDLSNSIKLGVLQHHEKMNSTGYPMGVSSDKINLFARIISVADIYDALVTQRPYKKPFSPRDAVEMIMSMTEELDINVMRSFLESIILYSVGTDVELSTGEKARVIENNSKYVLRPKVVGLTTGKIYDLSEIGNSNIVIV
jgi:HD-GYP domain-containing protein (c-di-GMP phosphodiesterase class II)